MQPSWKTARGWVLTWLMITLAGVVALARLELAQLQDSFETNGRIMHRLLSQRVVQHEAILATLALLQPGPDGPLDVTPEQRLPALYGQILSVQRRDRASAWPDPVLRAAEIASRSQNKAVLGSVDFAAGRYQLLLASQPSSYALTIDLREMVPWAEWPLPPTTSPVRVVLMHADQTFVLQAGQAAGEGWSFEFHKHLATASQPFNMVATQTVGWQAMPWSRIILWALLVGAVLAGLRHGLRQRAARSRAEELLRLGQVARLNTLGELAAGMAHELNQPLTAVMANTHAARRLLDENPPELATARAAMAQAVEQARRAADVVGRLRRVVERPDLGGPTQAVNLSDAVRRALYLLEPECQRRGVTPWVQTPELVMVQAELVALEQIIHNLLMNALQALEKVAAGSRSLILSVSALGGQGQLSVTDTGVGIAPDVLPRIFEPFFSTREGGLGLGLSLCETLATSMSGSLTAKPNAPHGAVFSLNLPLAGNPS